MFAQRLFLASVLILTGLFSSPKPAHAQVAEGVAAVVNDEVISTFDVRQRMRMIISSAGVQPDEATLLRVQQQALNTLVEERLQIQETKEFDIVISQEEIDQAITRLARQNNVTIEDVKNDLKRAGISPRTLEDQLRAELAWQILVNGRYGSRVRVSNNQIAQAKARIEASLSKPQFLISEVFLESPSPEQDPIIYQGGLSLIAQMNEGAPFQAVARQFSALPSATQGGDVGWVFKDDLVKEVLQVLEQTQTGTITPPIKVPGGYYIIALRDRKDGDAPIVVDFRQIVAPANKANALKSFMGKIKACDDIDGIDNKISGAFFNAFEGVALDELAPAIRSILESLQPDQASLPVDSPQGSTAFMLCAKGFSEDAGIPGDEQIEDQLINTRVGMLARRYLRDLRRDSTVEIRQ